LIGMSLQPFAFKMQPPPPKVLPPKQTEEVHQKRINRVAQVVGKGKASRMIPLLNIENMRGTILWEVMRAIHLMLFINPSLPTDLSTTSSTSPPSTGSPSSQMGIFPSS